MNDCPASEIGRPRIALTLGDPAGIGPEVVARAWTPDVLRICRPIAVGHPAVLARAAALINPRLTVVEVDALDEGVAEPDRLMCWNPGGDEASETPPGVDDARGGRAAYEALRGACWGALVGTVDAITTAPLSKAALHLAGLNYPGHTEILAELCQVREHAMMLYIPRGTGPSGTGPGLAVAHVTLHVALRTVPDRLTIEGVGETIELVGEFLRRILPGPPRIGVCALNPHAGEGGIFGDEEARVIGPAVAAARLRGWDARGPLPADTLLKRAWEGAFDGVVAMYHDQGHIALKLVGFDRAVNVTLGLPIVRTSPSHGTAYDIAWRGKANASGMIAAIQVAVDMALSRAAGG